MALPKPPAGTIVTMPVKEAAIHLHNLSQMFQSPLVLLEALTVVGK